MQQVEAAKAFIATFTAGVPADCYTYIWRKAPDSAGKKNASTKWFKGDTPADVIASYAIDSMASHEVYIGMGLSPADYGRYARLKEGQRDAAGVVGMWADIDFGTDGHKNGKLPKDEDEALEMLSGVLEDFPPTMVVNSGGGLHVYWLFDTPLLDEISDSVTLDYIREFARRWYGMLASHAKAAGYDLDPCYDVERVLRVAGTINHKYDPARIVTFVAYDPGVRYTHDQLWEACKDYVLTFAPSSDKTSHGTTVRPADVDGDLIIDARRQPPLDKLEALRANTRDFGGLWNKRSKRIDESPDSSASTYEWNLVQLMLRHEWSDQEIVDAITYWRGKHHLEPQERPLHYFQQTIGKARAVRENGAGNNPPPPNMPPGDGNGEGDPIDERAAAAQQLSRDLGLAHENMWIKRIVRLDGQEPFYRLETTDGKWFDLGVAANLADYHPCVRKFFSIGPGFNVRAERAEWFAVKARMRLVTDVEEVPEARPAVQIMALLEDYLEKKPLLNNAEDAEPGRLPFWHNEYRCFFLRSFVEWLYLNDPGGKWSPQATTYALKSAGVEPYTVYIRNPNDLTKPTTRSVWRIPRIPLTIVPFPDKDGTPQESETQEA